MISRQCGLVIMSRVSFQFIRTSKDTCLDLATTLFGVHRALTSPSGYPSEVVSSISQHIAGRATLNAPIKTGLLRSRIKASRVEFSGSQWSSTIYVADVPYALVMHTALLPYGTEAMAGPDNPGDVRFWNRGPLSLEQPPTDEGGVGGLYISRVADFHSNQYFTKFSAGLDILFSTGQSPGPLKLQPIAPSIQA